MRSHKIRKGWDRETALGWAFFVKPRWGFGRLRLNKTFDDEGLKVFVLSCIGLRGSKGMICPGHDL